MNSLNVIECEEIGLAYGSKQALQGLSLKVKAGSLFLLVGLNGAGKTSLVICLLGLQKPQRGLCRLWREEVWRHRRKLMQRVGSVPENAEMPESWSLGQLGDFSASTYPAWDFPFYTTRLRALDLSLERKTFSLSKGQKAQLALSLALAHRPELLILEDPTLGLDALARRCFYQELAGELAERECTVFLTSHDLEGAEGLAQDVGFLNNGHLRLQESLESLKGRFRWIIPQANPPADEQLDQLLSHLGADPCQIGNGCLCAQHFSEAAASALQGIWPVTFKSMTLEDIFLALQAPNSKELV